MRGVAFMRILRGSSLLFRHPGSPQGCPGSREASQHETPDSRWRVFRDDEAVWDGPSGVRSDEAASDSPASFRGYGDTILRSRGFPGDGTAGRRQQ